MVGFGLKKSRIEGKTPAVRGSVGFVQNVKSARLEALVEPIPALEHALLRRSGVRVNGTLRARRKVVFAASDSANAESGRV